MAEIYYKMSFLHHDNDDVKAIAMPPVFSVNSQAKNASK